MEYNDEKLLNIEEYEIMAKAYNSALKSKGFMIIQIDNEKNKQLIYETFEVLSKIRCCLFKLGGFLNTSTIYSLTDRQIKKLQIIFDYDNPITQHKIFLNKTQCFLEYIGLESLLIKNLIELSEQSSFDNELKRIINDRLILINKLFNIKI